MSDPTQWSVNLTQPKYVVSVTGDQYKVVLAPGVPIGGISDAPSDGVIYGRQNASWVEIPHEALVLKGQSLSVDVAEWDAIAWGRTQGYWRRAQATSEEFLAGGIAVNVANQTGDVVLSGVLKGAHPWGSNLGQRYLSETTAGQLTESRPRQIGSLAQMVVHVSDENDSLVSPSAGVRVDAGARCYDSYGDLRAETNYAVRRLAVVADPNLATQWYVAEVGSNADSGDGGMYIRPDDFTTILWRQIA